MPTPALAVLIDKLARAVFEPRIRQRMGPATDSNYRNRACRRSRSAHIPLSSDTGSSSKCHLPRSCKSRTRAHRHTHGSAKFRAAAARAAIPTVNRATVFSTTLLLLVPYAVAQVRLQQGFAASEMGFELKVERQSTAGHLFWVLQRFLASHSACSKAGMSFGESSG
jgi:hypothetical protein